MKKMNVLGKEWDVELECMLEEYDEAENDTLVIARSGDKVFVEWIDYGHCRLETVDHAQGCENLSEEEYEELRYRINTDLENAAIEAGYLVGYSDCGFNGTLEYAGDDEELAKKIRALY